MKIQVNTFIGNKEEKEAGTKENVLKVERENIGEGTGIVKDILTQGLLVDQDQSQEANIKARSTDITRNTTKENIRDID